MSTFEITPQLLYAYVLGALDPKTEIEFTDYLESSGSDFPWAELGECQNITALLPSFSAFTDVPPIIKERLFKRIANGTGDTVPVKRSGMRIAKPQRREEKEEIPAEPEIIIPEPTKRKTFLQQTYERIQKAEEPVPETPLTEERPEQKRPPSEGNQKRSAIRPGSVTQVLRRNEQPDKPADTPEEYDEPVDSTPEPTPQPPKKKRASKRVDLEVKPEPEELEENGEQFYDESSEGIDGDSNDNSLQEFAPRDTEILRPADPPSKIRRVELMQKRITLEAFQQGSVPSGIFWIVTLVLLSVIIGVYVTLSSQINTVATADSSVKNVNKTITMNQDLLFFLNSSKNIRLGNLRGTADFPNAYGKFFYNPETATGYLQLTNLFSLSSNLGFQLWAGKDNYFIQIGSVQRPQQSVEQFVISNLPDLLKEGFTVLIVTEEKPGVQLFRPSQIICMTGNL